MVCGCRLAEALSASESRCGELEGRATRALEDARTLRTQLDSAKTQQRALQQVHPLMISQCIRLEGKMALSILFSCGQGSWLVG